MEQYADHFDCLFDEGTSEYDVDWELINPTWPHAPTAHWVLATVGKADDSFFIHLKNDGTLTAVLLQPNTNTYVFKTIGIKMLENAIASGKDVDWNAMMP